MPFARRGWIQHAAYPRSSGNGYRQSGGGAPPASGYVTPELSQYSLLNTGAMTMGTLSASGLWVSPDGLHVFIAAGGSAGRLQRRTMTVAHDLTTLGAAADSSSLNLGAIILSGITLKPDGTKLWYVNGSADVMVQLTLPTPFIVSGTSVDGTLDMAAEGIDIPVGIAFSYDGLHAYVAEAADEDIYQYTLNTAWNILDEWTPGGSVAVSGFGTCQGVTMSQDGLRMLVTRSSVGSPPIEQYNLTVPFDVTTATLSQAITPGDSVTGIYFADNDDRIYVTESDGTIYQYAR